LSSEEQYPKENQFQNPEKNQQIQIRKPKVQHPENQIQSRKPDPILKN
jgi:hypothetical protein